MPTSVFYFLSLYYGFLLLCSLNTWWFMSVANPFFGKNRNVHQIRRLILNALNEWVYCAVAFSHLNDRWWGKSKASGAVRYARPHLVELTDVVQSCVSLRSVQLLSQASHVVQLHWKFPFALRSLPHPLLHDLHQEKLWVQQSQHCGMCLWTPQVLSKTHLWIITLSSCQWIVVSSKSYSTFAFSSETQERSSNS